MKEGEISKMYNRVVCKEGYPLIPGLKYLRVYNFKSFQGEHCIGPFMNLTGIIGPNGGGKSNILDAMSYALGMTSTQMRHTQVAQLINRPENSPGERERQEVKMWVEMCFQGVCASAASTGSVFKRALKFSVGSGYSSLYYISGALCTYEEYKGELKKLDIYNHSSARTSVVYQGQVDTIARKSGMELTALFEEISGSKSFKRQYEQILAQKSDIQGEMMEISRKMTELRTEKRKAKGLKSNAERYSTTRAEIEVLEGNLVVSSLALHTLQMEGCREKMEGQEIGISEGHKHKLQLESALNNLLGSTGEVREELERIREEKEKAKEKVRACRALLERNTQRASELHREVTAGERGIGVLREEIEGVHREQKELQKKKLLVDEELDNIYIQLKDIYRGKGELEERRRAEYYETKNQLSIQNYNITSEISKREENGRSLDMKLRALHAQGRETEGEKAALSRELALQDNIQELINRERELQKGKKDLQEKYESLAEETINKGKRLHSLENNVAEREFEYNKLLEEWEQKREKRAEERLIDEIRRKVGGFRGKLVDLIYPIESRFALAVKVALGGYLGYYVVDNNEGAKLVANILKEKSLQKDLLILNNFPRLQRGALHNQEEDLRGEDVYALSSLISYRDPLVTPIILHFAKSKIVCEDISTAHRLQMSKGYKQIYTIQGDSLNAGCLSGGTHVNIFQFSYERDISGEQTKKKEEIEEMMKKIRGLREDIADSQILKIREGITGVSAEITKIRAKIEFRGDICKKAEEELGSKEEEYRRLGEIIEDINGEKLENERELEELRDEMGGISSKLFKSFCKKLKIKNISEYESTDLVVTESLENKKRELEATLSKLSSDLELNQTSNLESSLKILTISVNKMGKELKELKGKEEENKKIEENGKIYSSLGRKENKTEEKMKVIMEERKEIDGDLDRERLRQEGLRSQLMQGRLEYWGFIQERDKICEEEMMKNREFPAIRYRNEKESQNENVLNPRPKYKIEEFVREKVDLTLPLVHYEEEVERMRKSIENKRGEISDINGIALLLQAELESSDVSEELKNISEKLEEQSRLREEKEEEFRIIREQRMEAFNECFGKVRESIDGIYKELTYREGYGGQALLYPENSLEPYLGTIQYAPTPPGKRAIYEIEQLSGGEKTMAALALILSIQQYLDSPFLILDEVDAFLDKHNCALLLQYILNRSQGKFQCIMITHKEAIYSAAHSLLGVYLDNGEEGTLHTSRVLSYDLRETQAQSILPPLHHDIPNNLVDQENELDGSHAEGGMKKKKKKITGRGVSKVKK